MPTSTPDVLAYYAQPGPMTAPGPHAALFDRLPRDIAGLVACVQGLMLHVFWAQRYGVQLDEARQGEVQIRPVERKLARILELDSRPLTELRPLQRRLVGNCRDFSTLLCAMLRHQGLPARARCGFGTYFVPGHYEDHWVVEYWSAAQGRWLMVDAQLDELQRRALAIDFDPLDMPPGRFVTGGTAWQMCRNGLADPDAFGIFDMHGLAFVAGDLVRDFLALNRLEILPWDAWGLIRGLDEPYPPDDLALLDRIAALTLAPDACLAELRALFEGEPRLRAPDDWQP